MENASKALIIAGAILLSILIISLGIMVYNNAKNTVGSASLDKQEIETFNSQWQAYVGKNKTASEVYTMMSAVVASNASETNSGKGRFIKVTKNGTAPTAAETTKPTVTPEMPVSSSMYEIKAGYGPNGLIVGMTYSAMSSSDSGTQNGGN